MSTRATSQSVRPVFDIEQDKSRVEGEGDSHEDDNEGHSEEHAVKKHSEEHDDEGHDEELEVRDYSEEAGQTKVRTAATPLLPRATKLSAI